MELPGNAKRGADNDMPHPMQEIYLDDKGVARFRVNAIVRFLLDDGPNDMNRLARIPFSDADREQFAQLIGYSVSGFEELSYASDAAVAKAAEIADNLNLAG